MLINDYMYLHASAFGCFHCSGSG